MGNKDAGNLGMQESVSPAQNEMYADFIVKYMGNFQEDLGDVPGFSFQKINGIYGVVYAPLTEIGTLNINTYSYSFIPKCYTHMDLGSLSASGITRLQEHPYLQLKGSGTAVAVVDSGIDYRNPVFRTKWEAESSVSGTRPYREMGRKCLMVVSSGKRILIRHWLPEIIWKLCLCGYGWPWNQNGCYCGWKLFS